MKSLLKILLLLMLPFVVAAQSPKNTLDSLHLALRSATNDTMRMNAYDQLNNYYMEVNLDSALYHAEMKLSIARKLNLTLEEAKTLDYKGFILMELGNYPMSLEASLQALKIAENTESEKSIYNIPKNKTKRTLRLAELEDIYLGLGHLYRNTGNTEKAIPLYLEAKRISESINDSSLLAIVYMNLGATYLGLNKFDSALLFENMSLALFNKVKSLKEHKYKGVVLNIIGTIYQKMGKNELAHDYLYKAVQINQKRTNLTSLAESYLSLSNLHRINNQLDSSIIYAKKSLLLVRSLNTPLRIADAYTYLSLAYKEKNDLDSAYAYLNLASTLKDSLNKIKIQKLNEFQNVGFNEQMRIEELEKEKIMTQGKIRTYGLLGGICIFLIIVFLLYRNNKQKQKANKVLAEKNTIITREKTRSEELLLNILPFEIAQELKEKGKSEARLFDEVTVMFTDFKGFTQISENLSPSELVKEIDTCFKAFDEIITKYNIEKIKTIGDSYMCAGGLPIPNKTNATDVAKAAIEIRDFMQKRRLETSTGFEIRIGVHTGPVVAGIVGIKKFAYDIWGDTVNIASRMESSGEAGKVNISATTCELVKDKFSCIYRGKVQAKGKGEIDMYFVENL